jgi:hypothetical protein
MAAGQGFKTFVTGEVLTSGDVNGYLMQGILVFASEAARNSAITSPQEGQFAFTKDTNSTWYYDGAAWVASGGSGDVTGITAGTGITVTSSTGPVPTVTNDMATTITASGDIVVGTGSGTYDNLPIGTTGQILTADTTVSPYKVKWATASGSTLTVAQIGTGTLSGSSVTITGLSTYDQFFIQFRQVDMNSVTGFSVLLNNNTGASNYNWNGFNVSPTTSGGSTQSVTRAGFMPYYQGNLPTSAQDNDAGFTLTNCKSAGFTTASWTSAYKNSNSAFQAEAAQGIYLVAEAVSSIVFSANSGSFDGGTYTIWGA